MNFPGDTSMSTLTYNGYWKYSIPAQKLLLIKTTFRFLYEVHFLAYLLFSFDSNTPQNYNATTMIYNWLRNLSWSLAINKAQVLTKIVFYIYKIKLYTKQKR